MHLRFFALGLLVKILSRPKFRTHLVRTLKPFQLLWAQNLGLCATNGGSRTTFKGLETCKAFALIAFHACPMRSVFMKHFVNQSSKQKAKSLKHTSHATSSLLTALDTVHSSLRQLLSS